jgi:hypothetical protein
MTHAQFRHYVTEVHGPLVRSVTEVAADIRHYHYNFPVFGSVDPVFGHKVADHLDIVTQGWFDSREAQLNNMRQRRYLRIIRPDEGRFASESGALMHYTHEVPVIPNPQLLNPFKAFYFRRRRPSLTREAFQDAWRSQFGTTVASHPAREATLVKYVQNHALSEVDHPDGASTRFFDVIDELFLRTPDSLQQLKTDTAALERMKAAENELLDISRTMFLMTETIPSIP